MERIVKQDNIGKYLVSTVKLPVNHGYGTVELWYETMIFPKDEWSELYTDRYTTEEEAIVGHAQAIALAQTMEEDDNETD